MKTEDTKCAQKTCSLVPEQKVHKCMTIKQHANEARMEAGVIYRVQIAYCSG